jgi:hypothetical protein
LATSASIGAPSPGKTELAGRVHGVALVPPGEEPRRAIRMQLGSGNLHGLEVELVLAEDGVNVSLGIGESERLRVGEALGDLRTALRRRGVRLSAVTAHFYRERSHSRGER